MTDWQPIETAPRDGTKILVGWVDDDEFAIVRWRTLADCDNEADMWGDQWGKLLGLSQCPTHWMPLPEGP